jgi:hypothetical protein
MSVRTAKLPIPGSYSFGPSTGTLSVLTTCTGAAAKAGHDLVIDVTSWEATLQIGEDPARSDVALDASGASFCVREGTGGMKPLGDEDKASIGETIEDILGRQPIRFRSTAVELNVDDGVIRTRGDLVLIGNSHAVAFDILLHRDGRVTATAAFNQTDWGIKPYRALFGALQVADEVSVTLDAFLPNS